MSTLSRADLSREEFTKWVGSASTGVYQLPTQTGTGGPEGRVTLVWRTDAARPVPIACVPERELRDFYAFTSTYAGTIRPYTAYFRVLSLEMLQEVEQLQDRAFDIRLARCVAGAALSETWSAARRRGERVLSAVPSVRMSPSSALGQAVLAGYRRSALEWTASEWLKLQATPSGIDPAQVLEAAASCWRVVAAAVDVGSADRLHMDEAEIAQFLSSALRSNDVTAESLTFLGSADFNEPSLVSMLASPREERIAGFNALVLDLKRRDDRGMRGQFAAGLMLAIAGNGSFDLLRSTRELEGWLDGAITWFGICAALFADSNLLSFSDCAGRRTLRDLLRREDPFSTPAVDISSTEYRLVDQHRDQAAMLGGCGTSFVDVEILPNVVARVLTQRADADHRDGTAEMLQRALEEIGYIATRARRLTNERERSPKQGDLYPSKGRGRSR